MGLKKIAFSGIQPSGHLHIGNYLGAIKQYENLQRDYSCFLSIVDLHAMTVPYDFQTLAQNTQNTAAMYIAAGIDVNRVTVFVQSQVSEHAEMAWMLSCFTSIGYLNRMVQFKQKSGRDQEKSCLGLYSYPCLMAADILLYQADVVPVGDDQEQHIELTVNIAQRVNYLCNQELLTIPKPLLNAHVSRIMSLRNAGEKMSKTDTSDYTRINLSDDNDTIAAKIKKAITDSHVFSTSVRDLHSRPEVHNLSRIYLGFHGKMTESDLIAKFAGKPLALFKTELTELLISVLEPIRLRYQEILANPSHIRQVLQLGQQKAKSAARKTLAQVKEALGLYC